LETLLLAGIFTEALSGAVAFYGFGLGSLALVIDSAT